MATKRKQPVQPSQHVPETSSVLEAEKPPVEPVHVVEEAAPVVEVNHHDVGANVKKKAGKQPSKAKATN